MGNAEKERRARVSPRNPPVVSQLEFLPAEIQYAIMDYLGYKDVLKVQKALRWTLPGPYWRTRIDTRLFFEVNEVLGDERINWQFLALQLEKGEAGPARIFLCDLLQDLVRDFKRLLDEDQSEQSA
ncbi:uncharacterized protein KD926_004230 [Aspergillus affinis]|uniref:uncharacterized protein n=1 Tax=Aspergillus affinis TaxID=1070780 RepID=UPI0022FDD1C8|nr:uncharacterized protein KD926_004230 [Aspergillus affinis]KAI9035261.1 hypothetical protein KD926_004230 [Aspergillus affinis]